jgi:hypothetical protein
MYLPFAYIILLSVKIELMVAIEKGKKKATSEVLLFLVRSYDDDGFTWRRILEETLFANWRDYSLVVSSTYNY